MPPKSKITKDMILSAAFEIVRQSGHESLNVRAIAEKLGCSTQPVLYHFKTVDDIREAVYQAADDYHTRYISPDGDAADPLLALGLNYVRFGREEANLFRFLFQTNRFNGADMNALTGEPAVAGLVGLVAEGAGCGEREARALFATLFAVAHGLASLMANNAMAYDEAEAAAALTDVYLGMLAVKKEGSHHDEALPEE